MGGKGPDPNVLAPADRFAQLGIPTHDRYVEHATASLMAAGELEWFWDLHLAEPEHAQHPLAAPLLAEDLGGLPPMALLLVGVDPLCDEGRAGARLWGMGAALPRAQEATDAIAAGEERGGGIHEVATG